VTHVQAANIPTVKDETLSTSQLSQTALRSASESQERQRFSVNRSGESSIQSRQTKKLNDCCHPKKLTECFAFQQYIWQVDEFILYITHFYKSLTFDNRQAYYACSRTDDHILIITVARNTTTNIAVKSTFSGFMLPKVIANNTSIIAGIAPQKSGRKG